MKVRTLTALLAGALLIPAAILLLAGATAAESALHPARQAVALVCPCIARVSCANAEITTPDSTVLRAWYYQPDAPRGSAIILLHGIGASREDVVGLGNVFLKAGYSVLEPDLRGHGESGGFTTYGALEEQDVHAWAGWMLAQPNISGIYGFGASLGGSVLIESLNRESRFRGVIAESAYADFPAIAVERTSRALPDGLKWLAGPVVDSGLFWARLRYSARLSDSSPVAAVRRTKVPVFLIHGLEDRQTSPANAVTLAQANPAVTTLWLVPKAGHANVWATAGREFESRLLAWLAER